VSTPQAAETFRELRAVVLSSLNPDGRCTEALEPPSRLAFLQYTSGSTKEPRGVMVTQTSVMTNLDLIEQAFEPDSSSIGLNWLPMHHDMGLIGAMLQPFYTGFPTHLMSPRAFLAQPMSWLKAITKLGATISGGPSFAYELCVARAADAPIRELDLSTLRVMFCGAEPIRVAALQAFATHFAQAGFDARALYCCYGLAESTLFVTGAKVGAGLETTSWEPGSAARDEAAAIRLPDRLAACGHPRGDTEVRVVDPLRGTEVAPGEVGEIWVRGGSVTEGYYGAPLETKQVFQRSLPSGEGPYLATGDLGLRRDGSLYVVGRSKDVLIVDAVKYLAHDIESTCRAVGGDAVRGALATELSDDARDLSGITLWLAIEPARRTRTSAVDVAEQIRKAVTAEFGVPVPRVALVPGKAFLRTSSGKLERSATLRELRGNPSYVHAHYTAEKGWRRACDVWRNIPVARPNARLRLFVLGAGGVGGSSYLPLVRAIPSSIEVALIHYPGRDPRRDEASFTRLPEMVKALEACFAQWAPGPYVLFGHSIGGLIAFELARRLCRSGLPPHALVIASCSEPSTIPEAAKSSYRLPPPEFDAYVRALGVLPEALRARAAPLPEALVSMLRADLELHDTAQLQPLPRLSLPGLLLCGADDHAVRPHNLEGWGAHFDIKPRLVEVPGNHFFPQDNPEQTVEAMADFLSIVAQSAARGADALE
jgi:acyl-CoA synthetase (AMP-forming)/AMP-acid ligase II/surfactin synthase thioesterase subunit